MLYAENIPGGQQLFDQRIQHPSAALVFPRREDEDDLRPRGEIANPGLQPFDPGYGSDQPDQIVSLVRIDRPEFDRFVDAGGQPIRLLRCSR